MPTEGAAARARHKADAAARARALAPEASFLVRAPAGSGKTELVIQRYLRLLALVDEPEAILAVTFTRKAAGEMRRRVLEALAAADQPEPEKPHEHTTWQLARAARARDAERGWNLLSTPARLAVQTLDSLALTLAARMPWLARRGAPPQPLEEVGMLRREASRRTLRPLDHGSDARAEAARAVVRHMGADLDAAETLLAQLLEYRDQWELWIRSLARLDVDALAQALAEPIRTAVQAELRTIAAVVGATEVRPLPAAGDVAGWQTLADRILTKAGTARKNGPYPDLAPEACAALARARGLPEGGPGPAQLELMLALCLVLPVALTELHGAFREAGACDFTALTETALAALGDDAAPSALAFALDARVQHVFVDEFQDTSRLQYALLQRLVADWTPGDGRTLFVVGDPMQSIYGFRNAEVELFLKAEREHGLGPVPLEALTLSLNFRSQPEVVAWCNRHFAPALAADTGNVGFTASVSAAEAGEDAEVQVHALAGEARLEEAERVATIAKAEQESGAKVAILALARSHLDAILPELRRQGVPFEGARLLKLSESPVVGDLLALTRALHDSADRVAWLAVLRAPWCGLTLADLHALCAEDGSAQDRTRLAPTVTELWADPNRRAGMSGEGRARAERTMTVLAAAAARRGREPMRQLVAWCWHMLEGQALVSTNASPEDAAAFFRLLDEMDKHNELDVDRLSERIQALYAPPDPRADGTVKVMTIHLAKGLEFDTVIIPGLDRRPRGDGMELLRWISTENALMVAARPEFDLASQDPSFEFVGSLRKERDQQEQARLLYVAATRARRRLHLVGAIPITKKGEFGRPASNSALARVWPTLGAEFERQFEFQRAPNLEAGIETAREPEPLPPPRLRRRREVGAAVDFTQSDRPGAAYRAELPGSDARVLGIALHALFRDIAGAGGLTPPGEARVGAHLRAAGVLDAKLAPMSLEAGRAIAATLGDERGRWILGPHEDARCEWEISALVAGRIAHQIIDRTFVDDGTRWVIDYKTATPEPGQSLEAFLDEQVDIHRPQIEGYGALLRCLDQRPIRLGLYFPLVGGWREWPYI